MAACPSAKIELDRPIVKMDRLPTETCAHVIQCLDFSSINNIALTSARFARIAKADAVSIADRFAVEWGAVGRDDHKAVIEICGKRLPNGTPHGRTEFIRRGTIIFRVTYVLGKPTYWRTKINGACVDWGYTMSPYYVFAYSDYHKSYVRFQLRDPTGAEITICLLPDHGIEIANSRWLISLTGISDLMREIPRPAPFIVGGDINLAEIEKWGSQILNIAHSKWPNLVPIARTINVFGDNPKIIDLIDEHCPEVKPLIRRS